MTQGAAKPANLRFTHEPAARPVPAPLPRTNGACVNPWTFSGQLTDTLDDFS